MSGMRLVFAVFLTLLVQLTLADDISVAGVQPDFTVLLVVLLSLRRGPVTGTLVGFSVGLLQDLLVPATLGMNSLAKSLVGWSVGKLSAHLAVEGAPLMFVLVGLSVLAHDLVYLACLTHLDVPRLLTIFVTHSIPAALYTAIVGTLIGATATVLHLALQPHTGEGGMLRRG